MSKDYTNLIKQFMLITDTQYPIGEHFLQEAKGNVNTAINNYYEVEGKLVKNFNPSLEVRKNIEDDEILLSSPINPVSNPSPLKETKELDKLFSPPTDIMFNGSFDETLEYARKVGKYVVCNILKETVFKSLVQQRDCWNLPKVKVIMKQFFVFFQVYYDEKKPNSEGFKLYKEYLEKREEQYEGVQDFTVFPYIGIINPFSAKELAYWTGLVKPGDILVKLNDYYVFHHEKEERPKKLRISRKVVPKNEPKMSPEDTKPRKKLKKSRVKNIPKPSPKKREKLPPKPQEDKKNPIPENPKNEVKKESVGRIVYGGFKEEQDRKKTSRKPFIPKPNPKPSPPINKTKKPKRKVPKEKKKQKQVKVELSNDEVLERNYLLKNLHINPFLLRSASEMFKNDRELVSVALKSNKLSLIFVGSRIRENEGFIRSCLE